MRRRYFIQGTAAVAATASAWVPRTVHSEEALVHDLKPVIVGIMGYNRGRDLAEEMMKIPGVILKYICETDRQRGESGVRRVAELGGRAQLVGDFRKVLDDPTVDALVCAAPNHWHGPATLLGCKAGKHVYVEKPASHNPQEGEWMVQAANKYQRCVQVGNQRRSSAGYRQAMEKLHAGVIGKVYLGRTFFSRIRGPIGTETDGIPPDYLDYQMWQGPAPRRPYRKNVVHYNWHWFWHWGNGELGNNGPHGLDICRWGLQVDYPIRTVSSAGRYRFDDDQETPDTHSVSWEFEGGKKIDYQGLSHTKHPNGPLVSFYGYDGYMEIDSDGGYQIFDNGNKLVETSPKTDWGQKNHVGNFIEAVRANDPSRLRQPILSGHQSTLLCHLGNIAHRTGCVIHTDASSGRLLDTDLPQGLWRREYDPAWEKLVSEI